MWWKWKLNQYEIEDAYFFKANNKKTINITIMNKISVSFCSFVFVFEWFEFSSSFLYQWWISNYIHAIFADQKKNKLIKPIKISYRHEITDAEPNWKQNFPLFTFPLDKKKLVSTSRIIDRYSYIEMCYLVLYFSNTAF